MVKQVRQQAQTAEQSLIISYQAVILAKEKEDTVSSTNHTVFRSTCGILFLGTPHDGSRPSSIGKALITCTYWMGSSSSIMDTLGYQSTELRALDKEFTKVYKQRICCVYETRKTLLMGILRIVSNDG